MGEAVDRLVALSGAVHVSGYQRHGALGRLVRVRSYWRGGLPPLLKPGEAPIPPGTVRLFHYTPRTNVASIAERGLRESYARGDSGNGDLRDPSAGVWASTDAPVAEGHRAVVEFWARPEQISTRAEYPGGFGGETDPVKWAAEGRKHVIMRGDVPPEQIVAIHEPWHNRYRYMEENDLDPADIAWIEHDTSGTETMLDYQQALRRWKAERARRG